MPESFSPEAADLIKKFLDKNPKTRLGCCNREILDIKEHPFFASIDWEKLAKKELEPPYIPKLENEEDCKYIDNDFKKRPIPEQK